MLFKIKIPKYKTKKGQTNRCICCPSYYDFLYFIVENRDLYPMKAFFHPIE